MQETYQPVVEQIQDHEQAPVEASLFDHYSIDNEVDFLRKIEHLPVAEQQFYVRENILGFLGEYAGRIPYKKISYVMKDGAFDFAGIKMRDMYQKILGDAERGSREWNETVGMLKVEDAMQDSNVNVATILSPPKIDNYSFAFHFAKGQFDFALKGTPIVEYILRYPEKMHAIENSKKIAKGLTFEDVDAIFTSQNDFLTTPFLSYSPNPNTEQTRLLELVGIDHDAIRTSQEYEKLISHELMPWIDRYFDNVFDLKNAKHNPEIYGIMKGDTEQLLGAIYNRARMLREVLDEDTYEQINYLVKRDTYSNDYIKQFANSMKLTVAGGSCPIVKRKEGALTSYLSIGDIYSGLLNGQRLESIMTQEYFKCPKCKYQADGPIGNTCPGCGLTKEKAAKDGIETC